MADPVELEIIPSKLSDVYAVAEIMRKEDCDEVMASGGYTPDEALRSAFFASDFCSTAYLRGDLVAMFGVVRAHGVNIGWVLTTENVEKHPFLFYKACKKTISELLDVYPSLVNMIDDRHKRALSWAKHIGFDIGPAVPFGPNKMLFRRVEIGRAKCASLLHSALPQA